MLLIRCPYCEMERPEIEFKYGGEAHLVRPLDPAGRERRGMDAISCIFAANDRGLHAERWRHAAGCGRFFNCLRDTVSDKISATYKAGQTRPGAA